MLGLLALMISFTFAMALSRFDARRDALLREANAIGTAALRARLLPTPYGAESLKLFRDYVQIRLDITTRVPTPDEMDAAIARSNAIQEALWLQVKSAMVRDNSVVPTGLYIQAKCSTIRKRAGPRFVIACRISSCSRSMVSPLWRSASRDTPAGLKSDAGGCPSIS